MRSPRYTILIANRNSGAVRRLTLTRRTTVFVLAGLAVLPLLIGLGVSGADPVELESLRMANDSLRLENDSYRAATGELAEQISSLQTALSELGDQGQLDPAARQASSACPRSCGRGLRVASSPPPLACPSRHPLRHPKARSVSCVGCSARLKRAWPR
jgi:hypothetical protein